jgi:ABC-type lipoprotein release transport system permease subunit
MGRTFLIVRLAARDLRRRGSEAALLFVALAVATTTLTLGLVLHGEQDTPYAHTRAATRGPDVVAAVFPASFGTVSRTNLSRLRSLDHATGVTGHSGPFPVTWAPLQLGRLTAGAEVEGRDRGRAVVDQPEVTNGTWVHAGGAVLERTFATALGARIGDDVRIGGHRFPVIGIAVTTAFTPYPRICTGGCELTTPALRQTHPGLVWLARSDVRSLASKAEPLTYFSNLRLHNAAAATSFVASRNRAALTAPMLRSWQDISFFAAKLERNEQQTLMIGSWLLGLIAIATVTVLVGARVADQTKRAGMLKALGATPALIARLLVAEYLAVAGAAAISGLLAGWLLAPLFAPPDTGLLGHTDAPTIRPLDLTVVLVAAIGITIVASFVTALRAARTSTVRALDDSAHTPRRHGLTVRVSGHLPTPILVGVRVAARRPRRTLLAAFTIAVAVTGIVAVMFAQATLSSEHSGVTIGLPDPDTQRLGAVMVALTVSLAVMAAVNLVFIATTTALDARIALAVTRAMGASPGQAVGGLAAAQTLPALLGVAVGWPAGAVLFAALNSGGDAASPPLWWLIAIASVTVLFTVALTAVPARHWARRPIAATLDAG